VNLLLQHAASGVKYQQTDNITTLFYDVKVKVKPGYSI